MKTIEIHNFKGFSSLDRNSLPLSERDRLFNILLYAENGVGKTSLTEAIRMMRHFENEERLHIPSNVIDPERGYQRRSWLSTMMYDSSLDYFTVEIDGTLFDSRVNVNSIIDDDVYILDRTLLIPTPVIKLDNLMNERNFNFSNGRDLLFSTEFIDLVYESVNQVLKNEFLESIEIKRSQQDSLKIVVVDKNTNGSHENGIERRFNEAKQNLIKILVFVEFLVLDKEKSKAEKTLVVLDDIVTSLDVSNRVILTHYLLGKLKDCQVLLMTHSSGFFNLVNHHITACRLSDSWKSCSLQLLSQGHGVIHYQIKDSLKKANHFRESLRAVTDMNSSNLPNEIRKHLESLLHEFAKLLMLGPQEETRYIFDKIETNPSNLYCCVRGDDDVKTIYDLVFDVKRLVRYSPDDILKNKLKTLLEEYDSSNEFSNIVNVVRQVDTFQKVTLHPGSHSQSGLMHDITKKELAITIDLIDRLEKIVFQPNSKYPKGI